MKMEVKILGLYFIGLLKKVSLLTAFLILIFYSGSYLFNLLPNPKFIAYEGQCTDGTISFPDFSSCNEQLQKKCWTCYEKYDERLSSILLIVCLIIIGIVSNLITAKNKKYFAIIIVVASSIFAGLIISYIELKLDRIEPLAEWFIPIAIFYFLVANLVAYLIILFLRYLWTARKALSDKIKQNQGGSQLDSKTTVKPNKPDKT